jgi:hypothetical protein
LNEIIEILKILWEQIGIIILYCLIFGLGCVVMFSILGGFMYVGFDAPEIERRLNKIEKKLSIKKLKK